MEVETECLRCGLFRYSEHKDTCLNCLETAGFSKKDIDEIRNKLKKYFKDVCF